MASLKQSIIETVSFFDCLDMPLREGEVRQYLWRHRASELDVADALKRLVEAKELEQAGEFYMLPNRGHELVMRYVEARSRSERLWRTVKRAKWWLQWLPFIRGVCVCNSLAFGNVHTGSDIDLLIVVAPGHIWHARFLATVSMHYRRLRRHHTKIAERICLSFFVTTDALNFEPMKIAEDDIYLSYWVRTLKPLFGIDAYRQLMHENIWVANDTPNFSFVRSAPLMPRSIAASWYQRVDEWFLRTTRLDYVCEQWLRSRMKPRSLRKAESLGPKSGVIISENIQKFHDTDRRSAIREAWIQRSRQNAGK